MNKLILIVFLTPLLILGQEIKSKKFDHPQYSIEYPENWILDEFDIDCLVDLDRLFCIGEYLGL